MKKAFLIIFSISFFAACGKNKTGVQIAREVCDCYKNANGMKPDDPKRTETQNDCLKKQGEAWNKVKDDQQKAKDFNKTIGECSTEVIQKSFGQ
jgi:hypothetical protein